MSVNGDVRLMNNLGEIVEEEFDKFQNDLTELKTALENLSQQFYAMQFKEYQIGKVKKRAQSYYKASSQVLFNTNADYISGKMESVFTVMKDMNAVISLPKSDVNTEASRMQNQAQNNFFMQAKPLPIEKRGTWLQRMFGSSSELPPELEDAHRMTKDLHLQTLNIQNLWKKLLHVHNMGIVREGALSDFMDGEPELESFYVEGQDEYARIEAWYFNTYVKPEVLKLVERGMRLGREKFMNEIVVKILIRSSEHDERLKLANPMMNTNLPQKPNN